jgi:cytochrome c2
MSRCNSILASAGMLVALSACVEGPAYQPRVDAGDADRGRALLAQYECGVCHAIPGIPGAIGRVGPPLDTYARRPYIAGKLPNTPDMLIRWIPDAPSLAPGTAMPAIAMTSQEARDMTAYLYELD